MPPDRPPTQKQLATQLGVSQALVSRALSGRAGEIGASRETVERIRQAAAAADYHPNTAALVLLGASTRTLGVVVRNFDDPFLGQLVGTLQSQARATNHSLLITGDTRDDLAALRKHGVDGVILAGSEFQPGGLTELAARGVAMVRIGSGAIVDGGCELYMDEPAGISQLVEHLTSLGHVEVGFVGSLNDIHKRRADHVRRAMHAHGLTVRLKNIVLRGNHPAETAEHAASHFLNQQHRPTALITAEDAIAIPMLRLLYDAGLQVPNEMSITGIDDIPFAAHSIPPLTTLQQPVAQLAAAAFRAVTNNKRSPATMLFRGTVIVRASTATHSLHPTT